MATDARISLLGEVTDVGGELAQGQQTGERFRTAGVREQLLDQSSQVNQQSIAQTQGAYMNQLATGLKGKSLDQRAAIVAQQLPFMAQMGFNPADILSQDLSNQGLDGVITQTLPFVQPQGGQSSGTAGMQDFQFYQSIIDSPNSTPQAVRAAKIAQGTEASQGRTQLKETGVKGVFQIFDSNNNTLSAPMKRDPEGNLVELSRAEQLKVGLAEQVEEIVTTGDAQTDVLEVREEVLRPGQVETAEQLTAIDVTAAGTKQAENIRQQRASARKTQFSDQLQQSAAALPRLTEALKLAEVADQGLTGRGRLLLSRLPGLEGIDVADSAALDSALTQLSLAELQKFKGPTTDFEFGVTQNISGQLVGSAAANKARIAALQRNNWFLGREAEQFNNWADQGGDPDRFAFNFEEVQQTGKGGYTLREIQDTAVANNMTIEQVLEALNK